MSARARTSALALAPDEPTPPPLREGAEPPLMIRGDVPGPDELRARAAELQIGPQAVALMSRRGIVEPDAQVRLLRPRLSDLRPPAGMAGFEAAIELLQTAHERRLRIGVFGDYDVDGVTTTAILTTYLEALGLDVIARAAAREGGYGFQLADARALREAGAQIVLTGDCGTSDHEALAWLEGQGIPTAVIDHHQVPERMPPASALLNPHQPGCNFPFKGLCSAGVAFYLCAALRSAIARRTGAALPDPRAWLDLVALGTICDMVPLVDENRILVRHGLGVVASRRRPGLRALLEFAGVGEDDPIDESHLGFRLGPRLNAPGRLGPAEPSLLLLRSRSAVEARAMAERVEHFNAHRREHQDVIVAEALAQLAADPRSARRSGLVVAGDRWLHGIVGIAAAGVVARYRRPALVLAVDRERGEVRGSARTAGDIDVLAALRACAPHLRRFGGHRAAAGVSLDPAEIPALTEAFDAAVAAQIQERALGEPQLLHDGALSFDAIDERLLADLEGLGPYGVGFAPPRFVCEGAVVERVRVLKERHLSLALRQGRIGFEAIAFGQAAEHPGIGPGDRVAFLYVPMRSSFRGRVRVQLQVETMWAARGF